MITGTSEDQIWSFITLFFFGYRIKNTKDTIEGFVVLKSQLSLEFEACLFSCRQNPAWWQG